MKVLSCASVLLSIAWSSTMQSQTHVTSLNHRAHSQASIRNTATLSDRYEKLSCAVVLISSDLGAGTGFFIGPDGYIATAAHVVMSTKFSLQGTVVNVEMTPQPNLKISVGGQVKPIALELTAKDAEMAASDVIVFHSNLKPACYLKMGDAKSLRIGAHLIAIGYPGFEMPAAALYEGFLSSRHPHLPIPVGSVGLQTVTTTHEVLRVQMPITPGTSGSPIISDDDKVVGIVSEEPVLWTKQLADFLSLANTGVDWGMKLEFANGATVDPTNLLAQLALIIHEFESPGAGLAVPSYYLVVPEAADHPVSK
jgi:S1-C subfamily serine protease